MAAATLDLELILIAFYDSKAEPGSIFQTKIIFFLAGVVQGVEKGFQLLLKKFYRFYAIHFFNEIFWRSLEKALIKKFREFRELHGNSI